MLLSKAGEAFESDKRIEGFSPQTLKAYRLQASLLIKYFKDIEITNIETNLLKEYLSVTGKHLKPSSLSHRIRFMKSLFRWSHEEGHL
ncbi:site-specific integrase, partial [Viridibacillus arvi]|uniref:site-specific integrase n=1 Tax=Viridibacillus arvi TaxID=263475 RepID=UPI001FE0A2A7